MTRSRTASGAVAAPLVALALAAACAPAPRAATNRLLDRIGAAEVVWLPNSRRPPKPFVRAAGLGEQNRRHVARLTLVDGEAESGNRAVLVAPAGARYRFPVELPESAALRFGVGVAPGGRGESKGKRPHAPLRFVVRVESGPGEPARIVWEEIVTSGPTAVWRDVEVDLSSWGGSRVVLELATDRDGGGARAWGAWSAPEIVVRGAREPGWDVVLVSLDTLRADRLGAYGYERRPTSPFLDRLAGESIRFESAITPAPWTRPAHRALFNGVFPLTHVGYHSPPLAVVLREAGWRTGAFTGGGQVDYRFGFSRGFDEYHDLDWIRDPGRVVDWMARHRGRRRFLFLHTYEVHDPYLHTGMAAGMPRGRLGETFDRWEWERVRGRLSEEEKAYVDALYDGGVAFTDRALGDLFARLESAGHLDRAVVLITSDHGEQLFEHGSWRHGSTLYEHQIRVPLIVRLPRALARERGIDAEGRVVEEQAELVDLYPTLLDLLGVERTWPVHGRSLVPLLGGETFEEREALSEDVNIKTVERKALRNRRFKYIHTFPKPRGIAEGVDESVELYDLRRDPGEKQNVVDEHPDTAAGFEELLRALLAAGSALEEEEPEEIDPDLRKRLEALGYIG